MRPAAGCCSRSWPSRSRTSSWPLTCSRVVWCSPSSWWCWWRPRRRQPCTAGSRATSPCWSAGHPSSGGCGGPSTSTTPQPCSPCRWALSCGGCARPPDGRSGGGSWCHDCTLSTRWSSRCRCWRWWSCDAGRSRAPRASALISLVPSVDNVAHFHMFATIRDHGAITQALGDSPDGSAWSFDNYPQGFHSLVATVAEWMHPSVTTGAGLLPAYTEGVAVVVVLVLTMLVAAVVSLPALDHRPLVALPVVVITCTAYLWSPGQVVLADGFANFWVASAAGATALVLAVRAQPAMVVATGGGHRGPAGGSRLGLGPAGGHLRTGSPRAAHPAGAGCSRRPPTPRGVAGSARSLLSPPPSWRGPG